MDRESERKLFKTLGKIEAKVNFIEQTIKGTKKKVDSNTKFRIYCIAFLALFTGLVGIAVQLDRLKFVSKDAEVRLIK